MRFRTVARRRPRCHVIANTVCAVRDGPSSSSMRMSRPESSRAISRRSLVSSDRDDLQIAAPSHQHADVDHAGDRPRRQRQPLPLVRRNGAHENRRKAAVGLLEVDDGGVPRGSRPPPPTARCGSGPSPRTRLGPPRSSARTYSARRTSARAVSDGRSRQGWLMADHVSVRSADGRRAHRGRASARRPYIPYENTPARR